MKPLFQLRPDATIDQVTGYLVVLNHQLKAVQDTLFELTCAKKELVNHFEEIGGLIAQQESNIKQMGQMVHFLNDKKIEVVKS